MQLHQVQQEIDWLNRGERFSINSWLSFFIAIQDPFPPTAFGMDLEKFLITVVLLGFLYVAVALAVDFEDDTLQDDFGNY